MATFELINNTIWERTEEAGKNKGRKKKVREWVLVQIKTHFGGWKKDKFWMILLLLNIDVACKGEGKASPQPYTGLQKMNLQKTN